MYTHASLTAVLDANNVTQTSDAAFRAPGMSDGPSGMPNGHCPCSEDGDAVQRRSATARRAKAAGPLSRRCALARGDAAETP